MQPAKRTESERRLRARTRNFLTAVFAVITQGSCTQMVRAVDVGDRFLAATSTILLLVFGGLFVAFLYSAGED